MGKITIVGLGPGNIKHITLETYDIILKANQLIFRTAIHPTVSELEKRGIKITSFDYLYEQKNSFDEVYANIVYEVLERAKHDDIVYAVPGSPVVAEKTVELIKQCADQEEIKLEVLPGMSFLEVLFNKLSIDPIAGLTILDACDLDKQWSNQVSTGLVITQLYSKYIASEVKLTLMEVLPDEHEVTIVQNLSLPDEMIRMLPLYELDRIDGFNHLTTLYVPPYEYKQDRFSMQPLIDTMATLRSPNGCPWDIEQTHESLRRYLVEEVYEVLEAIELKNTDTLCEELGDLLLQVVFHARIAEENGTFSMQDVINGVTDKLIRRHPHVFGDITVKDAGEVIANWETIKKREKSSERKLVLDGVSPGLPSLMRAFKLQQKAAKVGFDWHDVEPVWNKVYEELSELKEAIASNSKTEIENELGDVLFSIVNLARFIKVEPEVALTATNNKFIRRFNYIEGKIHEKNLDWNKVTLKELDKLWEEAKNLKNT